jgi:hypothetical protein
MKRLAAWLFTGLIVAATGLGLASVLRSGSGVVAGPAVPPLVAGASVDAASNPGPIVRVAPAAADATLSRTYAANEFRPNHSDLTFAPSGPAMYATSLPIGDNSFRCPLDLPQGAQLKRITFYVVDNSATRDLLLLLYQVEPSALAQTEIASVTTNGLPTSPAVQSVVISGTPLATIDNARYAYALRYRPIIVGSAHLLVGATVEYSLPSGFLPFVNK